MTVRLWKRIAYWVSIVIVLVPVLLIDYTYLQLDFAPLTGLAAAILAQIMCAAFFVIMSREKRFNLAWRWLIGFGISGFVVLIMIAICTWF